VAFLKMIGAEKSLRSAYVVDVGLHLWAITTAFFLK
jgi:hypothetical protein